MYVWNTPFGSSSMCRSTQMKGFVKEGGTLEGSWKTKGVEGEKLEHRYFDNDSEITEKRRCAKDTETEGDHTKPSFWFLPFFFSARGETLDVSLSFQWKEVSKLVDFRDRRRWQWQWRRQWWWRRCPNGHPILYFHVSFLLSFWPLRELIATPNHKGKGRRVQSWSRERQVWWQMKIERPMQLGSYDFPPFTV